MRVWADLTLEEQQRRRDRFGVKTLVRILVFGATPGLVLFTAYRDYLDWRDPEKTTRFKHIFSNAALNFYEAWRWSITGRGEVAGEEW